MMKLTSKLEKFRKLILIFNIVVLFLNFFCVGGILVDLRLVKKDLFMFTGNKNFSLIFKNSKLQLYVSKRHDIVFLGHPCSHKLRSRFSLRIEPDI